MPGVVIAVAGYIAPASASDSSRTSSPEAPALEIALVDIVCFIASIAVLYQCHSKDRHFADLV